MVDTARRAVIELAASQHRTFTRRQAAELNFDSRRVATGLRDGWLAEPRPGVLILAESRPTWEQMLHALVLATGNRGVVSHRAAARLHQLDGFESATNATLEVSVPRGMRLDAGRSAVVHHVTPFDPIDITTVNGFPCVTIERCLAELGSVVPGTKSVRRALTSARRRGLDLDSARATAERLHRPGQAGTGMMLRLLNAIPFEGRLPATWFEELLALCLDDRSLPEMVLQHPIRDESGRVVARPDIAFPAVKLGLEAHSRRFHFGPDAEALDEARDVAAALCGWELTYLGWYATKQPAAVLAIVKELIRVRAAERGRGAA